MYRTERDFLGSIRGGVRSESAARHQRLSQVSVPQGHYGSGQAAT
jgi:hypothetical protein